MGRISWATPLMLFLSLGMCYYSIDNYVNKELNRDIADLTQDEIIIHVKSYMMAMMLGISISLFIHASEVRHKVYLFTFGIVVMIVTSDMRWNKKKLPDPDSIKGKPGNTKKRIIFIRHGESLWNEAFNGSKRPDKFLYQTMKAFIGEIILFPEFDSVLIDSPLNETGFAQAKALGRALSSYPKGRLEEVTPELDRDIAALRGDENGPSSVIVSSNLRRATQTAVVALWDRLRPAAGSGDSFSEEIKVLSALQEVSRNVDTLSLAGDGMAVPLQGVANALNIDESTDFGELLNSKDSHGNKPVFGTGLQRLESFCEWAHNQEEEVIICAGHSLWFKHFFNTYLPKSAAGHDALDCKMKNGGCVAFDLERGKVGDVFVNRASADITIVEGGFDNKKKKSKAKKTN
jgi:broad specificity phosphatase PhoE